MLHSVVVGVGSGHPHEAQESVYRHQETNSTYLHVKHAKVLLRNKLFFRFNNGFGLIEVAIDEFISVELDHLIMELSYEVLGLIKALTNLLGLVQ